MTRSVLALTLLIGCKGGDTDSALPALADTGWFDNTANYGTTGCAARITGSLPEDGVADWYWRDNLQLYVEASDPKAYWVQLVDGQGREVPTQTSWTGEGLKLDITLLEALQPESEYTLIASDCAGVQEIDFTTSDVGQPMQVSPQDLVGTTWSMEMADADWHEPAGAQTLILLYFTAPALLGVQYADDDLLDVMGAAGQLDKLGTLTQAPGSTWNFPAADFTGAPFFTSDSTLVTLEYDGVSIPVHNAHLEATILPDASGISGGKLSGLGDTRELGELLGVGSGEDGLCTLAAGLGVDCEPCPDGEPYCLPLSATGIEGDRIDGLVLQPTFN